VYPGLPAPPRVKVTVKGDWTVSGNIAGRAAVFDPVTGRLHMGGLQGHPSIAGGAGLGGQASSGLTGLIIYRVGGIIYFVRRGGMMARPLSPEETTAIGAALAQLIGLPAKYGFPPGIGLGDSSPPRGVGTEF
jgi:hypothetical protein